MKLSVSHVTSMCIGRLLLVEASKRCRSIAATLPAIVPMILTRLCPDEKHSD